MKKNFFLLGFIIMLGLSPKHFSQSHAYIDTGITDTFYVPDTIGVSGSYYINPGNNTIDIGVYNDSLDKATFIDDTVKIYKRAFKKDSINPVNWIAIVKGQYNTNYFMIKIADSNVSKNGYNPYTVDSYFWYSHDTAFINSIPLSTDTIGRMKIQHRFHILAIYNSIKDTSATLYIIKRHFAGVYKPMDSVKISKIITK